MKYLYLLFTYLSLITSAACLEGKPRIFVNQVVEHPALNATRQGIYDTLEKNNYLGAVDWSYECAQGNPAMALQIAQKALGKESAVIVGIGTTSAQACKQVCKQAQKPGIVFASVTDPQGSGLVKNLVSPEGNITGVSNFVPIEPQLAFFQRLLPQLKCLGVIYNPAEANSVTLVKRVQQAAASIGINVVAITANKTAEVGQAAQALFPKVDAIYITNDNTALAAFRSIVRVGFEVGKPVFCSDVDMVEQGALAAMGPDQYAIGCQVGEQIIRILDGALLRDIAVEFPDTTAPYVNPEIAKRLKIILSAPVLYEAHLVSTR